MTTGRIDQVNTSCPGRRASPPGTRSSSSRVASSAAARGCNLARSRTPRMGPPVEALGCLSESDARPHRLAYRRGSPFPAKRNRRGRVPSPGSALSGALPPGTLAAKRPSYDRAFLRGSRTRRGPTTTHLRSRRTRRECDISLPRERLPLSADICSVFITGVRCHKTNRTPGAAAGSGPAFRARAQRPEFATTTNISTRRATPLSRCPFGSLRLPIGSTV